MGVPANQDLKRLPGSGSNDMGLSRNKRIKIEEVGFSWRFDLDQKRNGSFPRLIQSSDPFAISNLLTELDSGKYGTVTKEIHELVSRRKNLMHRFYAINPCLASADVPSEIPRGTTEETDPHVLDIEDDDEQNDLAIVNFDPVAQRPQASGDIIIIDSDDDDDNKLQEPSGMFLMKDILDWDFKKKIPRNPPANRNSISTTKSAEHISAVHVGVDTTPIQHTAAVHVRVDTTPLEHVAAEHFGVDIKPTEHIAAETKPTQENMETIPTEDKGEYVSSYEEGDDLSETNSDGLGDIWNEMSVALECSKDGITNIPLNDYNAENEGDCEHSFILKDDVGDVCCLCGVIKRAIESIIEYNFSKSAKSTRTYSKYEAQLFREPFQNESADELKRFDTDFSAAEICPHPRHMKEMKPHQFEGFNFLVSNLVTDNPGGCIMAHAPGSGKTFMIISFLQSFMAKYPAARPLVVLPRGILPIWKKEFIRWQVEDLPLYDFYSVKADGRSQQLEVLKEWINERSVLFLGYKQFSSIICDTDDSQAAVLCQDYLLRVPTILILDEGHTPRNQDTDVLTSLERVQTPRKVVLSGTLYQNHVEEVFNILNLVRPKFLKMEHAKAIKRRIMSRAEISSSTKLTKNKNCRDHQFYELIEHTLIKDENSKRKMTVIQDLRAMTKSVLHYYKGDNLDELPGLTDFSVFLQLSASQRTEVKELAKTGLRKFTICAQGSAIYLHPKLKALAKQCGVKDRVDVEKINMLMNKLNVKEGAKLNFYLNLLQLCESSGEKLLVFSQYLLPLKFLEMITGHLKGYSVGREMFMITGESDNDTREHSMEKFNTSSDARVFFGSIKACGEGISLVGASRIIILDVHLNPSVTRQAIGRAFRPGQVRKVYVYRLIASKSPEEEDHLTCFRKESIAKMWFEWDECSSSSERLEMKSVDVENCNDEFLVTPRLSGDITAVFTR